MHNICVKRIFSVYKLDVLENVILHTIHLFFIQCVGWKWKTYTQFCRIYFKKGMHFILPNDFGDFSFEGNLEIICSHI